MSNLSLGKLAIGKICVYHSNKNCFLFTAPDSSLNEKDIVEIMYGGLENRTAFFSTLPLTNSSLGQGFANENKFYLNRTYGKLLNISENDQLIVLNLHKTQTYASSITIEPLSYDDWQIMELNLEEIQNNLLNQIKCLYRGQSFPIWIEPNTCIAVKLCKFEPDIGSFTCINRLTRVLVEIPREDDGLVENQPIAGDDKQIRMNEWSCCMNLKTFERSPSDLGTQRVSMNCSNSTTVDVDVNLLMRSLNLPIAENAQKYIGKYVATIELLKSPMHLINTRDNYAGSSTTALRKFFKSIESSSHITDEMNLNSKLYLSKLYVLLNVHESSERGDKPISDTIVLPEFLNDQFQMIHVHSKFLVKAVAALEENQLEQKSGDKSKKQAIKLVTDSKVEVSVIKGAFVKFIDNNNCLCPLIFTNNMSIALKSDDGEVIYCKISLENDAEYVSVKPGLFLSNLITIKIEVLENMEHALKLEKTQPKLFKISVLKSSWFETNFKEITRQLMKNLDKPMNNFSRGIVLSGPKGSGKSTLCKFICNMYSTRPELSCSYYYINCQNFMSKTVDTIYDQLKSIYDELSWHGTPSLVFLENMDLLIENKSHTVDPSSMLYYSQIVECINDLIKTSWKNCQSQITTIVTVSCPISELPSLFHCLDENGLFTNFVQMKPHSNKDETREIIELILGARNQTLSTDQIDKLAFHTDGFVIKDIEMILEKILFQKWNIETSTNRTRSFDESYDEILYNYTPINMLDTTYYKASNQVNWSLIGGLESAKNYLTQILIWPTKYAQIYRKLAMKETAGVLLYGPSGCGKTLIASALANESKFNFISVKGPELLSKYIGNSEHNVRELFNKAGKAKPCIIFFDEFDSLAPKRGHDSTGVTDRVVNQLLTQLDGIEGLNGIYLLAATSRPDLIDAALLRPGRLDNYLYIDYPTENEIEATIKVYGAGTQLESDVDLKALSQICAESFFTGADIKSLMCDALVKAFHRVIGQNQELRTADKRDIDQAKQKELKDSVRISMKDLQDSLAEIKKTINKSERAQLKRMYENWKTTRNFNQPLSSISSSKKAKVTLA